jgi:ABC-type uncharacterized transport system permease subunit
MMMYARLLDFVIKCTVWVFSHVHQIDQTIEVIYGVASGVQVPLLDEFAIIKIVVQYYE